MLNLWIFHQWKEKKFLSGFLKNISSWKKQNFLRSHELHPLMLPKMAFWVKFYELFEWKIPSSFSSKILFHLGRSEDEIIKMKFHKALECLSGRRECFCTYLVQFSRYRMFSETVTSQIFSTHLSLTSATSCIAFGDRVTLYEWLLGLLTLLLAGCTGFICRFVDASVLCCICDAPPSMARNINEPMETEKFLLN